MSGRFLAKRYKQFESYIEGSRKKKNAPTLFKEFELLAERIEEFRNENPDKTVGESEEVLHL